MFGRTTYSPVFGNFIDPSTAFTRSSKYSGVTIGFNDTSAQITCHEKNIMFPIHKHNGIQL